MRDSTGETIGTSVGLVDQLLHVDQMESESDLHARFDIGRPLPLWSGAPARVLLAARADEEIRRVLSEHATTDVTPVNPPSTDTFLDDVRSVRTAGHAYGRTCVRVRGDPSRGQHDVGAGARL